MPTFVMLILANTTRVGQIVLTISQFLENGIEQFIAFISYNYECECRLQFINTHLQINNRMAQMPS